MKAIKPTDEPDGAQISRRSNPNEGIYLSYGSFVCIIHTRVAIALVGAAGTFGAAFAAAIYRLLG